MWDEWNCVVVWTFFGISLSLGLEWKTDLFPSCGHCWVFQISWHVECSNLTASSFRIWNSSAGIPSPPLALFIVILPKAHLTSHSRISSSGWVAHQHWCYSKRGVSKMSTEHVPPHPHLQRDLFGCEALGRTWGWSLHKWEVPLWEERDSLIFHCGRIQQAGDHLQTRSHQTLNLLATSVLDF